MAADRSGGEASPGLCSATVTVIPGGQFACEKDAGHEGLHSTHLEGGWEAVVWPDGTTAVLAPGWGRRMRRDSPSALDDGPS